MGLQPWTSSGADADDGAPRTPGMRPHALALAVCVGITLVALPLAHALDHANVVMVYLLGVAVVAVRWGRAPAIVASVASVLLFDFFFVEPRFSFAVQDAQYLITFGVMLAVALIVGALAARLSEEARNAATRESRMRALYGLARELSGALDVAQVAAILQRFLADELDVDACVLLPDADGTLAPARRSEGGPRFDVAVAQRVFEHGEALPFVDRESGSPALAVPLSAPLRVRGVLVVRARERDVVVPASLRPLLDAVAALAATVVERIHFVAVARDAQVDAESERLRASVLSAVSHDLRTPLTVLVGLGDTLAQADPPLPRAQAEAATTVRDEAARMARLVDNLLDMARLQSGRLALRKAWQPIEEVLGAAVDGVERHHPGMHVAIDIPADLPLLEFDAVLIERVIVNLLENAARHAAGGPIAIRARCVEGRVEVDVEDSGPGIPAGCEERIFEIFERAGSPRRGSGLGLAICRSIVVAHGGTIVAKNRSEGGACFTFSLPVGDVPAEAFSEAGTEGAR